MAVKDGLRNHLNRLVAQWGARHGVPPSGGRRRMRKIPPEGGTPNDFVSAV